LSKHEVRRTRVPFEVRATSNGHKVSGRGVTYNAWSEDIGFRERFLQGSLTIDKNLALLYNHDTSDVLSTLRGQTMSVKDQADGLYYTAKLPDTTLGNDVATLMARGDIGTETSFGFICSDGGDSWEERGGVIYRTISSATLFEISILGGTTAAYSQNYADLRSAPKEIQAKLKSRDADGISDDSDSDADADSDNYDSMIENCRCNPSMYAGCGDCPLCAEARAAGHTVCVRSAFSHKQLLDWMNNKVGTLDSTKGDRSLLLQSLLLRRL
jgi:uncharacterized protein